MRANLKSTIRTIGPVGFFLLVGAIFGLAFLLITPPFQGTDEVVHFYRSYQLSEGNVIVDTHQGVVGGYLPASLHKIAELTNTPPIAFYPQLKYKEGATKYAASVKLDASKQKLYDFSATAGYSPISYAPSSMGIFLGRIFQARPIFLFYMGRLADLACWLVLFALAIHWMPRKKWVFVALGLLPMSLFQAATINVDGVTTASLAIFLALVMKFRHEDRLLGRKALGLLLLIGTVMVLTKQVMFIFLPLALLLKQSNFSSAKQARAWKLAFIGLPLIFFAGWFAAVHGINTTSSYYNHQNPIAQEKFVLKNPESFINVMWNTYFYSWGDSVTRSFIGTFGWSDAPLSELIVTIGYIGLAFLTFVNIKGDLPVWLRRKEKLLLGAIGAVYVMAVSASLYAYYTPVGFKIITGLQGRYFIPLALLMVPIFYNRSLIMTTKKYYRRVAVALPLFLLTTSVITLTVRYFVKNV
ncbi:MAG: DUF2142 domain-containing protein [Candidatus Saccharimonadales bacterium]